MLTIAEEEATTHGLAPLAVESSQELGHCLLSVMPLGPPSCCQLVLAGWLAELACSKTFVQEIACWFWEEARESEAQVSPKKLQAAVLPVQAAFFWLEVRKCELLLALRTHPLRPPIWYPGQ